MLYWILFIGGGLIASIIIAAIMAQRWGRGALESTSENMETEANRYPSSRIV